MPAIRTVAATIFILVTLGRSAGSETQFWKDPKQVLLLGVERTVAADYREGVPLLETAAQMDPSSDVIQAWLASAYHLQRRLDEAALHYARVLAISPVEKLDETRRQAILRFAPRVFQVANDPFPLKDVVAVHHPTESLIAYHFFWEDDIDFPEDNDPCDHELVWVRYDATSNKLLEVSAYFHGRNLVSPEAVEDAHLHNERPRINVQWGKHGSLPYGWEKLTIQADAGDIEKSYLDLTRRIRLEDYNRATYQKLHTEGRRLAEHPLAKAWPLRFDGEWKDFVAFNKEIDVRASLDKRNAMAVSKWNNAVLQQHFISYNFRPKTEWPDRTDPAAVESQLDRRVGASADRAGTSQEWIEIRHSAGNPSDHLLPAVEGARLPADLPPATIFKPETPRYPNLWFYAPVSQFSTYETFVDFLTRRLRAAGFDNSEVPLNEGADVALSIEHLQPWGAISRLGHSHSLHIRLFWKRVQANQTQQARLSSGPELYWRIAASVHYEVEHANPFHADVVVCPICGRTGAYAGMTGSLVEEVHDPVGLELILFGTARGERVQFPSENAMNGLELEHTIIAKPARADMNTQSIAIVTFKKTR